MLRNSRKKGYILAVVMLFSLLLSSFLLTTFAVCIRYQSMAKQRLDDLREQVHITTVPPKTENLNSVLSFNFAEPIAVSSLTVWIVNSADSVHTKDGFVSEIDARISEIETKSSSNVNFVTLRRTGNDGT